MSALCCYVRVLPVALPKPCRAYVAFLVTVSEMLLCDCKKNFITESYYYYYY